jgi:hypothetical protein
MRRLEDRERAVFWEIGTNSLLEFEEGELQWLAEIGSELRSLIASAQKRMKEKIDRKK